MFIKLNYTANKSLMHLFRVLTDIINTPSVTDVTSFYNRANSATYTNAMIGGFDPANSTIIRTQTTGGVGAHMYGNPLGQSGKFTLEMPVWDDPSKYIYIQYTNLVAGVPSWYLTVATSMTGATMGSMNAASQLTPSTADNLGSNFGTNLSLGGYSTSYNQVGYRVAGTSAAATASSNAVRTLWVYLSNTAFAWSTNQNTATTTGFSTTANNITTGNAGPWIFSQTTRLDYWNKSSNSIYPMVYTLPKADGYGFTANDWTNPVNTDYVFPYNTQSQGAAGYNQTFATINLPAINDASTLPGFYKVAVYGFTKPAIVSAPVVNLILKTQNTNASSVSTIGNYQGANNWVGQTGWFFPSFNIYNANVYTGSPNVVSSIANSGTNTESYAHIPWGWNKHSWGAMGGSISELSNIYLFNGYYQGADEYTIGSTTYSIWPTYDGSLAKLGLAIPKQ